MGKKGPEGGNVVNDGLFEERPSNEGVEPEDKFREKKGAVEGEGKAKRDALADIVVPGLTEKSMTPEQINAELMHDKEFLPVLKKVTGQFLNYFKKLMWTKEGRVLKEKFANIFSIVDMDDFVKEMAKSVALKGGRRVYEHNLGIVGAPWKYGFYVPYESFKVMFAEELAKFESGNKEHVAASKKGLKKVEKEAWKENYSFKSYKVDALSYRVSPDVVDYKYDWNGGSSFVNFIGNTLSWFGYGWGSRISGLDEGEYSKSVVQFDGFVLGPVKMFCLAMFVDGKMRFNINFQRPDGKLQKYRFDVPTSVFVIPEKLNVLNYFLMYGIAKKEAAYWVKQGKRKIEEK